MDPRRGSRWQAPVAALLLLAAAVLALFPPAWLGPTRPVAPPASEMERGVRAALYLQAQQIEAYRAREGRLPASLADVAGHLDGIRFVRSNNRVYQLVGHGPGESPVVYDSARPDPVFHAAAEPFLGQAGDQP